MKTEEEIHDKREEYLEKYNNESDIGLRNIWFVRLKELDWVLGD